MSPEPLPWDRKDFFKERKHERSESVGSVARWRDSSHHHRGDFHRWGSAELRRPPGHGKQGGWHLFPDESGHGYAISRSSDKMPEDDNLPSVSWGDGKYGRNSRENRGPFGQRDWRGHSWETTSGSANFLRRPPDVNNDQRSVDDALAYASHLHSDFINTWDPHHMKDQHDKIGGVNGLGTGPRCDRENSLGSIDWKPLKSFRSGSLSSRGSGFTHSGSSRSMGGADSSEAKAELPPKNVTASEFHSEEAAACMASLAPSEDTASRKKPRLKWGEGLAKYEKKKVEPDVSLTKDGPVLSASNMEPCAFLSPSIVDKSPKVAGFSDCASPATPSSVACSSSPGMDDKFFGRTASVDNDVTNLTGSPGPGFLDHLQRFTFNLEKLDIDSLNNLNSSIIELLQSDDSSSVNSGIARSTAINKLLIWKADISKVLETTESEIDSLENELKSLKSASGDRCTCPVGLGSQLVSINEKSFEGPVRVSDEAARPEQLRIVSSDDPNTETMPLSTNINSIHVVGKEEEIDSPGSATSKLVEPLALAKPFSSCDTRRYVNLSRDVDALHSTSMKCLVPCSTRKYASVSTSGVGSTSLEVTDSLMATSDASLCCGADESLYNRVISSNKELAKGACEVFSKLLPKGCCEIGNAGVSSESCSLTFIMEKFAEKKRFARFKERVLALKFNALHHMWKEDLRILSVRKCRPKSHKKHELSVRSTCNGNQKNRSSIRSRLPYPEENHRLVPTAEAINFTGKLLSESQVKVHRSALKMPALILDEKKTISKFISSNGLVEDPLAIEKERAMINPWTTVEREIFLEKFAAFGKDFRKIASFLDHKTTADCVEFYYKNHKSDCFEKLKKQDVGNLGKSFSAKTDLMASGKKWNREAASLEILSAASVMAGGFSCNKRMHAGSFLMGGYGNVKLSRGEGRIRERLSSFGMLGHDRETFESISFCATSSVGAVEGIQDRKFLNVNPLCKPPSTPDATQNVDDGSCSDESCGEMDPSDWTDDEKVAFMQAVSSFGKDFTKIAQCVVTRSPEQCKVFYSKARKCLGLDLVRPIPENIGSPANDADDGGSDTDDVCVVGTGSVVDTDKSGTKTDEDLPLSVVNTYHDESDPVEARNLSAELNESEDIDGVEVDHEDANVVTDTCAISGESQLLSDGSETVLCNPDKSVPLSAQAAIITSDSTDVGKEQANKIGGEAAHDSIEPCESNSAGENGMVFEVSSRGLGNDLERRSRSLPQCPSDDIDDKLVAITGVVAEMKTSVQESCTTLNPSLSSVGNSCSGLSFDTESKHVSLGKQCISALYMVDHHTTANTVSRNAAATDVLIEKTATQDRLSSTCGLQGSRDLCCHNPTSNGDHQLPNPGNFLDHVEAVSIMQGCPLQMPIKKEVNGDMKCSSSATELPLLSQKIEQAKNHLQTYSPDSEITSRNGDVKLFGKILTNPSSAQKPNLTTKGSEENGIHRPNSSNKSTSMQFTGHNNADGNMKILKFDRDDPGDYLGLENGPLRSYGYWDGNRKQTGLSPLPDSAILLAKYPASFSNHPTPAKLEQHSLQAPTKSHERHPNGSNTVIDYQMFRSSDGPQVQRPSSMHRQDVYSEMQRINGFDAISSLQQQQHQGRGMSGVGGSSSSSGVSDPVVALKMHYSSNQAESNSNNISRDDGLSSSWAGKGGDLGR